MKKPKSTPQEYSTVCPYLMVEDVNAQIDFLEKVFNAKVKERIKREDGEIFHGEMVVGNVVIMLGKSRPDWPKINSMNYVFVENADQTYRLATKSGAKPIISPENREYGLREGGFTDPQGNQWWVAEKL